MVVPVSNVFTENAMVLNRSLTRRWTLNLYQNYINIMILLYYIYYSSDACKEDASIAIAEDLLNHVSRQTIWVCVIKCFNIILPEGKNPQSTTTVHHNSLTKKIYCQILQIILRDVGYMFPVYTIVLAGCRELQKELPCVANWVTVYQWSMSCSRLLSLVG